MAERYRYAAFISYSSKDAPFARRLHQALEGFGIPTSLGKFDLLGQGGKKNRVYPVFRDREEMPSGSLERGVNDALGQSNALIVICSPNSARSAWVEKEIEHFESQRGADKIFAVIAGGEPHASEGTQHQDEECFPPALRRRARAQAGKAEIVAGDARPGFDGFRTAWLKVVAGMIGVTPGQIMDRDRRARRQRLLQSLAVWALAAFCVGAVYALRDQLIPQVAEAVVYRPNVQAPAKLAAIKPGDAFQDCAKGSMDCPVMIVVPEGKFTMGDPPSEDDDPPQRVISVPRFAVSRFEITFNDWAACARSGGCKEQAVPGDSGWGRGDRPVINISWVDAKEYVRWLSQMTGANYRLLSEAELEYAARGVTSADAVQQSWGFGDDEAQLRDYGWYSANSDVMTHPVGQKRPNRFGLYDMHGNAWEWVEDCYADYDPDKHDAAPVDFAAPKTDPDLPEGEKLGNPCMNRVLRGGSYLDVADHARSAYRYWDLRTNRGGYGAIGFRVARSL